MTDAPWLGEMTAGERVACVQIANLEAGVGLKRGTLTGKEWGDGNGNRWVEAIEDAEQRARRKALEEAAAVADAEEEPDFRDIPQWVHDLCRNPISVAKALVAAVRATKIPIARNIRSLP